MSTSSLPTGKGHKRQKQRTSNNNNIPLLTSSENMNLVHDVSTSSSPESFGIRGQRSSSLAQPNGGPLPPPPNQAKTKTSLPVNSFHPPHHQHSHSSPQPVLPSPQVTLTPVLIKHEGRPHISPSRAAAAIHKSLRKALNVHPEKYKRRNVTSSRSLSPHPLDMPYARSRSIDTTSHRLRERETGSLTHDYTNAALPIIQLPQPYTLAPLPGSVDALEIKDKDSFLSQDYDMSTDEEDNLESFDDIITINVSGMRFQTRERVLAMFPETILGNPFKRRRYYNQRTGEYFFDRHRACFESILHIYQSKGTVIKSDHIPLEMFLKELKFFQFSDEVLEQFWKNEGYVKPPDPKMPKNKVLRKIWELMEYPDSSLAARVFAFMSILVICLSIFSFCAETVDWSSEEEDERMRNDTLAGVEDDRTWNSTFFWFEFVCSIWFSVELLLRFISAPEKFVFVKSFLNVLDFVAVAPFFVNIVLSTGNTASSMSFSVLRIVRLVRVFRIFKLSRHSAGLQVLGKTFRASTQEFALLGFFLSIALVLFSSGVYFAEQNEPNTKFTSIPASFWFVLATLSTVGYGDLVPTGWPGKIVGGGCALIGVITLALPVPIIVSNFKRFYKQEMRLSKMYALAQQDNASNASRKSFEMV